LFYPEFNQSVSYLPIELFPRMLPLIPTTKQIVHSEVPFSRSLYCWLCVNDPQLETLVRHDEREKNYLAWESVRKGLNPFFQQGTGFEGYLIGRCADPESALEMILRINQHILDSIARLYRFRYNFRNHLLQTLLRQRSDPAAIHIWSAYLGAELGKLRIQIPRNRAAVQFRAQTYNLIHSLPPMRYQQGDLKITQTYAVGIIGRAKAQISLEMLPPAQQDACLVALNIGVFGHPLVRRFLDHP
jgi:hypothetical protein